MAGEPNCPCFGAAFGGMTPWLSVAVNTMCLALALPYAIRRRPGPPQRTQLVSGPSDDVSQRAAPRRDRLSAVSQSALVFGLACLGAYWVATAPQRVAPPLAIADENLNIGDVWETTDFCWTLPIENQTVEDVRISGFEASCDCVRSIEPKSLIVPAKRTRDVTLVLDLTRRSRPSQGDPDEFGLGVAAAIDGRQPTRALWVLRGRARPFYAIVPASVHLGDMTRGRPFPSQTAVVKTETAVETLELDYDRSLLSVLVRQTDDAPATFGLSIAAQPNARSGAINSEVRIRAIARPGERFPGAVVMARGVLREDVQGTPDSLLFGAARLGETREETVVLRSLSNTRFAVEELQTSSPGLMVTPVGGDHTFKIKQRIAELGPQHALVTFIVRLGDSPKTTNIAIPISYNGLGFPDAPANAN